MTEEEWRNCTHPMPMLELLHGQTRSRKLRLFAASCCLHPAVWRLLNKQSRTLVRVAERFAEGAAPWKEVLAAAEKAPPGIARASGGGGGTDPVRLPLSSQAERAALGLALEDDWEAAWQVFREGMNLLGSAPADLLREIRRQPATPGPHRPDMVGLERGHRGQAGAGHLRRTSVRSIADPCGCAGRRRLHGAGPPRSSARLDGGPRSRLLGARSSSCPQVNHPVCPRGCRSAGGKRGEDNEVGTLGQRRRATW
jgi:hypothetical protein